MPARIFCYDDGPARALYLGCVEFRIMPAGLFRERIRQEIGVVHLTAETFFPKVAFRRPVSR